ncbi:MAG: hypothetical protein A2X64_08255 [Ignavibacteria bacterium GWF2_33_9]|nr:MAG: hypothetical protein A2X64_08255 [Ignavibacteria bacterium GWF2_33_9]
MAKFYKTPGVYIEEISNFPASVAQVETAIPAFIGYTEKGPTEPTRISSMLEFENLFGGPSDPTNLEIELNTDNTIKSVKVSNFNLLYDSLRLFYYNGGQDCWIVSAGSFRNSQSEISAGDFLAGLNYLEKEDSHTLILIPDLVNLPLSDASEVQRAMLEHCNKVQYCFAILDIVNGKQKATSSVDPISDFRNNIGTNHLKYGAAYYPWLISSLNHNIKYEVVLSGRYLKNGESIDIKSLFRPDIETLANKEIDPIYKSILIGINSKLSELPPSGAIAGVYSQVDGSRGVWKAPANVSLAGVISPSLNITSKEQDSLNVDVNAGKSINAIRMFTGKGVLVWGARTLAGNDNEWKYISVRRFFMMVEESIKKATEQFVFEPNTANTWVRIKAMIENFLITLWKQGALAGVTPDHAYFIRVGLNQTMTAQDILEGRLIVEIGLAVVRPAEFIILRFSITMNTQ